MNLLVLEDNLRCSELVCEHLRNSGYIVDAALTIADFLEIASCGEHSLYVIDLGLPDGDGLNLIRELRGSRRQIPILVTSGRAHVNDRIAGLEVGADDYLVKPYNCLELTARIRAVLRRPRIIEPRNLKVGALGLDRTTGEITHDGGILNLTPGERRLLAVLMNRRNQVVAKQVLENAIYEATSQGTSNAIEKLISRLRKRINATMGIEVKTIHGDGYRLVELR